jgi:hypothetical protein
VARGERRVECRQVLRRADAGIDERRPNRYPAGRGQQVGVVARAGHRARVVGEEQDGLHDVRSHGARLDPSSAAETDCDLVVLDDHRHGATPVGVAEHPLKLRRVLLDVDVLERDMPPLIVVTGGLRVRSGVFAEDVNHPAIVSAGGVRRGSGGGSDTRLTPWQFLPSRIDGRCE